MYLFAVVVRDTVDSWSSVESIHASEEGARKAQERSQNLWGRGTALNPARYIVGVRTYRLED